MTPNAEGLLDMARLSLAFARVNRVTLHEDGIRPESDTDHTVMLSLCACSLAEILYKDRLDVGLVAQFAIVHDLVEAYSGDTNTINISKEGRLEKEKREMEALKRIESEFMPVYPWLPVTIARYERRDTPEARFVKIVDKAVSKMTNTLNKGQAIKKLGTTYGEIEQHFNSQLEEYDRKYGGEFPELIALLKELMQNMLKEIHGTLH